MFHENTSLPTITPVDLLYVTHEVKHVLLELKQIIYQIIFSESFYSQKNAKTIIFQILKTTKV